MKKEQPFQQMVLEQSDIHMQNKQTNKQKKERQLKPYILYKY